MAAHIEIRLGNGRGVTIVDASDFPLVNRRRWHLVNTGYAAAKINCKPTLLHRLLMGTPEGMDTDHINGDKLDNRRCNLRICTRSENAHNARIRRDNTSGHTGVSFRHDLGKFEVYISTNRKRVRLGYFVDYEDACAAYDVASAEAHGEFAKGDKAIRQLPALQTIDVTELNGSIGRCASMAEELRQIARNMRGETSELDQAVAEALAPITGGR